MLQDRTCSLSLSVFDLNAFSQDNCIFCRIARGQESNKILYEVRIQFHAAAKLQLMRMYQREMDYLQVIGNQ